MKSTIIILAMLALLAARFNAQAQSKFETMLDQIAGLETYLKSTESVYSTTSKGLNDVHEAKNGSFTLHQTYFNSLSSVSPAVKNDPDIKAISTLQQDIQTVINTGLIWQEGKGVLSGDEMSYMKSVYTNLLSECTKDLQELTMVVMNGQLQMTDKGRIEKISEIYQDMQKKYAFVQSFTNTGYGLVNARISGKNSNQTLQTWYQLN